MKNKIIIIVLAISLITNAIFILMYNNERKEINNYKKIVQNYAKEACEDFEDYNKNSDESIYWQGVAAFYAFESNYFLLVDETNKENNYTYCNEVYSKLLNSSANIKSNIKDLIDALHLISENVDNQEGFEIIYKLRNV